MIRPHFFTFYSYKGGVGRSMALMNCAWELASRGRHVLMVDMDLEAPGLSGFLERRDLLEPSSSGNKRDLLDLLTEINRNPPPDPEKHEGDELGAALDAWSKHLGSVESCLRSVRKDNWPEHLTPAGVPVGRLDLLGLEEDRSYTERLGDCGIRDLSGEPLARYADGLRWLIGNHRFDVTTPALREIGEKESSSYDYVLIDSRTGITEIGGACLGPLSDRLVILLGLNDQNIGGTRMVLEESGLLPAQPGNDTAEQDGRWDEDVPEPYPWTGKPLVLVTSPVPTGEIDYKRRRKEKIEQELAPVDAQLTYHPLLALEETSFIANFPEESLANEYRRLTDRILGLVKDDEGTWLDRFRQATEQEDWQTALEAILALGGLDSQLTKMALNQVQSVSLGEVVQNFQPVQRSYEFASHLLPHELAVFYNWGIELSDHAQRKSGAEADKLFEAACDKYAKAVEIKPDKHEAFNNWGNALSDHAQRKSGAEADKLFEASYEKYAKAVELKPDMHEAFNNWGIALGAHAQRKTGAEADKLFEASYEKYANAVEIKPDKHEVFNNWGIALGAQAQRKSGAEANKLFEASYEKYAKALKLKPSYGNALFNMGCWHALRRDAENAIQYLQKAMEAGEDITQARIRDDSDFAPIINDERFQEFVESLLTEEEGEA